MARLKSSHGDVPVYRGAEAPLSKADGATEAVRALRVTLATDELTIVAFGPLTNVAAALQARPDLRDNVQKIIAVMGRKPALLIDPLVSEHHGSHPGTLYCHGLRTYIRMLQIL